METNLQALTRKCADFTGLTEAEVKSIAITAPRRYFVWKIPKRAGGLRTVCHPARELQPLQEFFQTEVLPKFTVHSSATAYKKGSSIKTNARMHLGSRAIAKFDFEDFFPSLKAHHWEKFVRTHAVDWSEHDIAFSKLVMFWGDGGYAPRQLAIGSKTSPLVSNILCFDIDKDLSNFAARNGLNYTRYADDITFSSVSHLNMEDLSAAIVAATNKSAFSNLKINHKKTVIASNRTRRVVTGLILTPQGKISIGRKRKRLIRSMLEKAVHDKKFDGSIDHLKGLLAFAQDVEPSYVNSLRNTFGSEEIDRFFRP